MGATSSDDEGMGFLPRFHGVAADRPRQALQPRGIGGDPGPHEEQEQGAALMPSWETTGFCTDLGWAQGPRLSICLAFRDDGPYRVRIAKVGREPPACPERSREAYQEDKWSLLYGDDDHPLAI